MIKVYRAFYKTDFVCADGYILIKENRTIEGLFALDYMYIHYLDDKTILFIKTKDFKINNGFIRMVCKNFEFYSSKIIAFNPYDNYYFFPTVSPDEKIQSISGLSLEIKEEIVDVEDIKKISLSIMQLRS